MLDTDKNLIESAFHILLDEIHGNAVDKGFWETGLEGQVLVEKRNKAEMIALMHSELSELLEAVRHPIRDGIDETKDIHCPEFSSESIECADLLIRLFDYCKAFNIPLGEAVFAKHTFNKSRPFKHGKRF